jgi:tetratricopeptide (TPR) repeat protein
MRHMLGMAYFAADDFRNAEVQLRKAAKLAPRAAPIFRSLGDYCVAAEKPQDAESYYQRALALAPGDPETRARLAGLFALLGKKAEARDLYRALIAQGMKNPILYSGLIEVSDYSATEPEPAEYSAAVEMAGNSAVPPPLRRMLHFSAAKIDRALGRRDAEFNHYVRAKSLFVERFDLGYFSEVIAALKQAITPEFFAARGRHADKSTRPIFILGMPRSGTTLTEQILAAHPNVAAAGELRFFTDAARALGLSSRRVEQSVPPERIQEVVQGLGASEARRLAAQYLAKLQFHGAGKMRVTDKMPQNFLHLWLIALLFPQAVFIHCVRDPLATCLSCYTTDLGDGHNYTSDFDTLAGYYRLYTDLMRHWTGVLPIKIIESRYEELVRNPEGSVRRLLEAARLPWSDSCLSPNESGRTANTASYAEVRKPIHAGNLEKWRAYAKYTEPLKAALAQGETSPGA